MGGPEHEPLRLLAMIGQLETVAVVVATHNREWQVGQVGDVTLLVERQAVVSLIWGQINDEQIVVPYQDESLFDD